MESFFNELSLNSNSKHYSIITNLKECYQELHEKQFTICRISEKQKTLLFEYLKNVEGVNLKNLNDFIYSFFRPPFEPQKMTDEDESRFINNSYRFNNLTVEGLAWAAIKNTLALSLSTDKDWDTDIIELIINGQKSNTIKVRNISRKEHLNSLSNWINSLAPIKLKAVSIPPQNKKFHVRDDHGKDELKSFWDKIKNNPYIIECVNSLPFNSKKRKFIEECGTDGIINLRLLWTSKGLGLCIKTTGHDIYETEEIAKQIESEYGAKY